MLKGNVLRKAACVLGRSPSPLRGEEEVGGVQFLFQGAVMVLTSSLCKQGG